LPFHGIISRGLLDATVELGAHGARQWNYVGPLLEDVLNCLTEMRQTPADASSKHAIHGVIRQARTHMDVLRAERVGIPPDDSAILSWVNACCELGVLTYAQSFAAAARFVRSHLEGRARRRWSELAKFATGTTVGANAPDQCELWSVREGHTSSVWRTETRASGLGQPVVFGLNVARDRDAARELVRTTHEMRRLHALEPTSVLGVLAEEIEEIVTAGGIVSLPVIAVPWIEQARELQMLYDAPQGSGRFVVVERFEPLDAKDPAGRQHARGRVSTSDETEALWRALLALRLKLTRFNDDGTATTPFFEINEGDLVWVNGHIVAIAVSEPKPALPLGLWVLELMLTSAGDPQRQGMRIFWNRPRSAIAVLSGGLGAGSADHPSMEYCLQAALEVSSEQAGHIDCSEDPRFQRMLIDAQQALKATRLRVQ
jgi:hypothetical protein